jgi:hypothetical protein
MNTLLENDKTQIANMHWSFFGCYMQQTPNAVMSFNRLINEYNFTNIIELGTHDGGLSSLFAMYCYGSKSPAYAEKAGEPSLYKNQTHHKQPKNFYTFDNVLRDIPRLQFLIQMGAIFKKIDFLDDKDSIEYVGSIIKQPGISLLLCDGGNKIKEFDMYSDSLKSGDFIMAHDWAYDSEAFKKIKERGIWNGHETWWDDIKDACKRNKIKQVHAEEFDDVVWFCGRKD